MKVTKQAVDAQSIKHTIPAQDARHSKVIKIQSFDKRRAVVVGTSAGFFTVNSYPCREGGIKIYRLYNHVGKPAYMMGFHNILRDQPEYLNDHCDIIWVGDLRDWMHEATNEPLMQDDGPWPVKGFVCACEEGTSDEEAGVRFAHQLEEVMNDSPQFRGDRNHVVYRRVPSMEAAGPQPVRHWLRDRDMLVMLKKMYGWDPHTTLEDIMGADEILEKFFHSAESGRTFLGRMEETQWQNIEA